MSVSGKCRLTVYNFIVIHICDNDKDLQELSFQFSPFVLLWSLSLAFQESQELVCVIHLLNPIPIECEGWRGHSSLIFLILLFTKPNIEVGGWLYQSKTHFTHIVYQPFSRVSPPSFTLYGYSQHDARCGRFDGRVGYGG